MKSINKWYFLLWVAVPFLMVHKGCEGPTQRITLETLLLEMTSRENMAKFPEPSYTCRQYSSYNTTSNAPGHYSWFANLDNNYFLRTETNQGRREFVLFDAEGPGSVVRFWATFARYDNEGILRFYFDNEDTPRIEGEAMKILSGGGLVGEPLSFSVSGETENSRRGHNLYLPLPYARHLKITYESDGIPEARDGVDESVKPGEEMFYYQVNYRTYKQGIKLETFKMEHLSEYGPMIEDTQEKLIHRDRGLDQTELRSTAFSGILAPEEIKLITLNGSRAIRRIKIKLDAENIAQALRSTVIRVAFDGEETIWAPLGDFFGAGYKIIPTDTWYQSIDADGTMQVFWVMPFEKSCKITIINYGTQDVEILDTQVSTSRWKWDERSMHFGSSWYQNTRLNTGLFKEKDGRGDMYDIRYTALNGQGVYVGDAVTLFNCSPAWWGEGDEKIFVDNEKFPSHFGTGTEDYYGYAWCRPESFIHPFISQPDGSGNLGVGYTLDMRYRCLDAIPFSERFQFEMEMWHWGSTVMNHAPITYWYFKPGGNCEIPWDLKGVKEKVVQRREQIFPPVMNEDHIIEGEDLTLTSLSGDGSVRIRPIPVPDNPRWKRSARMWTGGSSGDVIAFEFICNDPGKYNISTSFISRGDRTKLGLMINGKEVLITSVTGENTSYDQLLVVNKVELLEGKNELRLILHDAPGKTDLGIDYLEFSNAI
jgi:hypothetical protein